MPNDFSQVAFISLGSNLGDSKRIIRLAMDRLQLLSDFPILRSTEWKTSPVDCPPGSPTFVNAAAGLWPRPSETPESLLTQLQRLEQEFGRSAQRMRNEPRPLDLDLITFGTCLRATPQLVLPHPRACQRRFVLQPLDDIAPDFILPGQRQTVRELLDQLASPEIVARLD